MLTVKASLGVAMRILLTTLVVSMVAHGSPIWFAVDPANGDSGKEIAPRTYTTILTSHSPSMSTSASSSNILRKERSVPHRKPNLVSPSDDEDYLDGESGDGEVYNSTEKVEGKRSPVRNSDDEDLVGGSGDGEFGWESGIGLDSGRGTSPSTTSTTTPTTTNTTNRSKGAFARRFFRIKLTVQKSWSPALQSSSSATFQHYEKDLEDMIREVVDVESFNVVQFININDAAYVLTVFDIGLIGATADEVEQDLLPYVMSGKLGSISVKRDAFDVRDIGDSGKGPGDETGCAETELECRSGECVPANSRCDGSPQCGDASDEAGCLPSILPVPKTPESHPTNGSTRRPAAPYFTVEPVIQVVPEGGTAVFHCEAGGTPSPEIRWIHNGAPLQEAPNNSRRRVLVSNNTIVIENLTQADTGTYGCNATNTISFVYKEVYVNVSTDGAEDEIDAPKWSQTSIALSIVGIGLLIVAVILIVALWKKYNPAVKVIRNLTKEEVEEFYLGKNGGTNSENGVPVEQLPYPEDKRITREDVEIEGTVLGEGQFGVVHKGTFKDKCVAVKSSKSVADVEYFKAFLQDIKRMAYIGEHDNIVRFYGAVVDKIEDRICSAVLELCPLGDLHGYLRTHSKRFSETNEELSPEAVNSTDGVLTSGTLLQFCKQIAAGMEFLANKTVIHGDLAARNVLVYENGVVKVTDFGISRKLYDCANYTKTKQVPLPWRWMAIESLRFCEFSTKSDIWSFGVTMWEIFSLSQVPFADLQWTTDFADKLESGLRLNNPKHCDPMTFDWMMRCWASIPNNRPTFTDCKVFLAAPRGNGNDDNDYYPVERNNLASVITTIV